MMAGGMGIGMNLIVFTVMLLSFMVIPWRTARWYIQKKNRKKVLGRYLDILQRKEDVDDPVKEVAILCKSKEGLPLVVSVVRSDGKTVNLNIEAFAYREDM